MPGPVMSRTRAAALLFAALLYVLLPVDLMPDFWPLVGWIDDLLAIGLAGWLLWRNWKGRMGEAPPPPASAANGAESATSDDDPYAVLGVRRGATGDELRQAYRDRMAEYHPDKVAHLGPELRKLAEKKTLEIQRAYERLTG